MNLFIIGISSSTSIDGWLLNIVSSKVVPDLGKPIRKYGSWLSSGTLGKFQFNLFGLSKKFILSFVVFKYIFFDKEHTFKDRVAKVMEKKQENHIVLKLLKFLHNHSDRSYCMPDIQNE